ncbi:MAG: sulfur carrier protein ThiS [Bacteroidales bacterium]|nr:sulfur carrier protein ThiS [Bacteroidales bacterium]
MTVYLNEKPVTITKDITLSDFLAQQEVPSQGIAVAIDQKVIPRNQWESTLLADQQNILLIHIVSGG